MILYVLAGLMVVGGILMLFGAWLAACAVFGGTVIVAIAALDAARKDEERAARSEDPTYWRAR
jgi:uncharacterized membrane protein YphA (DoxX/SURF4 family)